MIGSTQVTNTEILAFAAVLIFKLLSRQVLFIQKRQKKLLKSEAWCKSGTRTPGPRDPGTPLKV